MRLLLVAALGLILTGCPRGPSPKNAGNPVYAPSDSSDEVQGASSGSGGGYVSENSKLLLEQSSRELSQMILRSTPSIFAQLPKGLGQVELAKMIENIRSAPDEEKSRDDKELMFDFRNDETGPYILALKPYFHVYGAVPVKFETEKSLKSIRADLQLKILHEATHHFGLDEEAAEEYAKLIIQALTEDLLFCRLTTQAPTTPRTSIMANQESEIDKYLYNMDLQPPRRITREWLISRGRGLAWYTEALGTTPEMTSLRIDNIFSHLKKNGPGKPWTWMESQLAAAINIDRIIGNPDTFALLSEFPSPTTQVYIQSLNEKFPELSDLRLRLEFEAPSQGGKLKSAQVEATVWQQQQNLSKVKGAPSFIDIPTDETLALPLECEPHFFELPRPRAPRS